jgi:hypothetical protein
MPGEQAEAWNPGIQSPVPAELRQLCTIFRPENVFTSLETADELHDLTGIAVSELVAFRPQRLVLHELLIRVTADLEVRDGPRIEDLGISFRQMTRRLLAQHVEPQMPAIVAQFESLRQRAREITQNALALGAQPAAPPIGARGEGARGSRPGFFQRLGRRRATTSAPAATDHDWELGQIVAFEREANSRADELERAVYRALARVLSALFSRHGRAWGARGLIATLAADLACNEIGTGHIGRQLEPLLRAAAMAENYYRLPRQERPVVMNTKGPSAAGKSSLRPLQKKLAGDIGVSWSDFALISPDIWRKQLLDYQSLGSAYKYAGPMTADELQIVDAKLDRYMALKFQRGDMSHLLIDRFRFDSFAPNSDEAGSNLLTRFGQTVYLFFVITPPESLVARAWQRGLEFGRYKAVGDTLAHSVEAYSGMPELFFTWVRRTDKTLHFEFLDNSVRLGEPPRSVAFGDNGTLNVLDAARLLDVERFRRINVGAATAELLYPAQSRLAPEHYTGFLQRCCERFREVNFAQQATGRVFLRMVSGKPSGVDREILDHAVDDADTLAAVQAVAPAALEGALPDLVRPEYLRRGSHEASGPTLGQWGWLGSLGESACA